MTMYALLPSWTPKSKTWTIPAWRILEAALASLKKRSEYGFVIAALGLEQLDHCAATEHLMLRFVDHTHSALTEQADDLVAADDFADHRATYPKGHLTSYHPVSRLLWPQRECEPVVALATSRVCPAMKRDVGSRRIVPTCGPRDQSFASADIAVTFFRRLSIGRMTFGSTRQHEERCAHHPRACSVASLCRSRRSFPSRSASTIGATSLGCDRLAARELAHECRVRSVLERPTLTCRAGCDPKGT